MSNYGCSVFIQPPREEYANNKYFKRYGKIPGDVYWQGRIAKLGSRKKDADPDNTNTATPVDMPEVSPTTTFVQFVFYLYWTVGGGRDRLVLYLLRHRFMSRQEDRQGFVSGFYLSSAMLVFIWNFVRGISNLGHLERVMSNHRQVILPEQICGKRFF